MIYKLLESIEISGANSNTRNINGTIMSSITWTPGYTVFLIQSTSIVSCESIVFAVQHIYANRKTYKHTQDD